MTAVEPTRANVKSLPGPDGDGLRQQLCHGVFRVDQFDHVYGNLQHCHDVFEVDQFDQIPCSKACSASPDQLQVVTDFSGLETPSLALDALGIDSTLVAASEISPKLRDVIVENFKPHVMHDSFAVEAAPSPGSVDLYVAGPPCQDFSSAGLQAGTSGSRGCAFMNRLSIASSSCGAVLLFSRTLLVWFLLTREFSWRAW